MSLTPPSGRSGWCVRFATCILVTRVDVIVSLLSHRSPTSRRSWEDEASTTEGTTETEDKAATEKVLTSEGASEVLAVVLCIYGKRGVAGEYNEDGRCDNGAQGVSVERGGGVGEW